MSPADDSVPAHTQDDDSNSNVVHDDEPAHIPSQPEPEHENGQNQLVVDTTDSSTSPSSLTYHEDQHASSPTSTPAEHESSAEASQPELHTDGTAPSTSVSEELKADEAKVTNYMEVLLRAIGKATPGAESADDAAVSNAGGPSMEVGTGHEHAHEEQYHHHEQQEQQEQMPQEQHEQEQPQVQSDVQQPDPIVNTEAVDQPSASAYLAALLAASQRFTPTQGTADAGDASGSFPLRLDANTAAGLERLIASLQGRSGSGGTSNDRNPFAALYTNQPAPSVLGKRKWDTMTVEDKRAKVRKTVKEHLNAVNAATVPPSFPTSVIPAPGPRQVMTTVRCMHASVAQKSYGTEKRFLCPPPVVRITGPLRHHIDNMPVLPPSPSNVPVDTSNIASLSMLVIGENGERFSGEQRAALDESMQARLKFLHVTGTGKAKNFRLQLNLLKPDRDTPVVVPEPPKTGQKNKAGSMSASISGLPCSAESALQLNGGDRTGGEMGQNGPHLGHDMQDAQSDALAAATAAAAAAGLPPTASSIRPCASFDSAPITIISKPSKKTAKARNAASQILSGSLVSLFNRINSQTVRTKYMCVEDGRLCARNSSWSAFRVTLVSRPPQASTAVSDMATITYGSTIVLTDSVTGVSSDPLVVCKVDKGRVLLPQIDPPPDVSSSASGKSRRQQNTHAQYNNGYQATNDLSTSPLGQLDSVNGAPDPNEYTHSDEAAAETAAAIAAAAGTSTSASDLASIMATAARAAAAAAAAAGFTAPDPEPDPDPDPEQSVGHARGDVGQMAGQGGEGDGGSNGVGASQSRKPSAAAKQPGEDTNVYGPVSQMQKVALMRFVPRDDGEKTAEDAASLLEPDFTGPRSFLCATVFDRWRDPNDPEGGGNVPQATSYALTHPPPGGAQTGTDSVIDPAGSLHGFGSHYGNGSDANRRDYGRNSAQAPSSLLSFATAKTVTVPKEYGPGEKEVDEVDDLFCWTLVGISQFEFSFFEANATAPSTMYGEPPAPASDLAVTPFPIITSMPSYNPHQHTLSTTVLNFYYVSSDSDDLADAYGTRHPVPMEVWLGPIGPLDCRSEPKQDRPGESEILVQLPPLPEILSAAQDDKSHAGAQFGGQPANKEGPRSGNANGSVELGVNTATSLTDAARASAERAMAIASAAMGESNEAGSGSAGVPDKGSDQSGQQVQTAQQEQPQADQQPSAPEPALQSQCLPLFFVRGCDGTGYHSGRHIACDDLFALVGAAGDPSAAEALRNLGVGLGQAAGASGSGAWSLRVV